MRVYLPYHLGSHRYQVFLVALYYQYIVGARLHYFLYHSQPLSAGCAHLQPYDLVFPQRTGRRLSHFFRRDQQSAACQLQGLRPVCKTAEPHQQCAGPWTSFTTVA